MNIDGSTHQEERKSAESSSLPFLASIKERFCLNRKGSEKQTYHIVLELSESQIDYAVGDCLGIYPENDPHYIEKILEKACLSGEEQVKNRNGALKPLRNFLLQEANVYRIPKAIKTCDSDFLHDHLANNEIEAQTLCDSLSPLLPRFYSIASSKQVVGNEAHLTVALAPSSLPSFVPFGTCSHFLCYRAPIGSPAIPLFLQRSRHFSLPDASNDKPIIMIGPGTGIAPFRGFMQERMARGASSKNWLFFGERNKATDFYYQDFWEKLALAGMLKVDCAFSRDQETKIYVQHKMLENSTLFWEWLEEGAYLYVCGEASRMAKDVDQTLHQIVQQEGKLDLSAAKAYIKNLRATGRYQRDVY